MKIDQDKVKGSIWVPIPTIFVFSIVYIFFQRLYHAGAIDGDIIGGAFGLILMGAIVWLPALIICLIIEFLWFRKERSEESVMGLLLIEILVPFFILHLFIGDFSAVISGVSLLAFFLAQMVRWFYLKRKNRLYLNLEPKGNIETIDL